MLLFLMPLLIVAALPQSVLSTYSLALRRYPYLTDVVGSYATINWATDRSETSGLLRFGKVGSESCTTHSVIPTKTPFPANGVPLYQWKAQLNLEPGTQYCYRVYLGTSPVNQIDLLGSDPAPSFWTQIPMGANQSFSFIVFGDWGYVNSSGTNPYQTDLMSLVAASGSRFALTTGDNGYPNGSQKNLGDLIQTGDEVSAVFGPSFWKVPGASLPLFLSLGNHGFSSSEANHPTLLSWPQDRAAATSGGRYTKDAYCCLNGTSSKLYPSAWYAFDAGPARFYVLQAAWDEGNVGTSSEYGMDYAYHWAPGTPQWQWLEADLATHPSVLKFAFFHYPLYSDNPQESASPFLQGDDKLEGLLKEYGVDIAFTGHAHIYERNLASASGIPNYITGGGGAPLGTLGACTALDAYAIKFTTTGKACGSAPVPTSAAEVYHFLQVTVSGTNVTVTPINSLGQPFDVVNYGFTTGAEATPPDTPAGLSALAVSGTQIVLGWPPSNDNTSVRGYGIYRNGVLVNTVPGNVLTASDTNLVPGTGYSYQVDAFDGTGNHSTLSEANLAITQNTATYTFAPVADSYVAAGLAGTNYGNSAFLRAGSSPEVHSYLRFFVGDVSGTVTKATLQLYTTSRSTVNYQVTHVTDQSWEEGFVNYTNAPAVGAVIGSAGNFAAGTWTNVDVTSLITGNGVYDLALTTMSGAVLEFNSRDASSNQPELVIETLTNNPTPSPTASPTPISTSTPNPTPIFSDVPSTHWAWQYVERLYRAGLTTGCNTSPLMYCPGSPVTRAQMAVFLMLAKHGSSYGPPAATGVVYGDVPASHWAAAWIEQMVREGITNGCGNNNYCPDHAVSRDQMAVFLLRAKYGSSYMPPTGNGVIFGDVAANHWAAAWIEQLVREGITVGCGTGVYCPAHGVNRDQMAVFLVRTFGLP